MQNSAAGLLLGKLLVLLLMSLVVGITHSASRLLLSLLVDWPTILVPSFKEPMLHSAALHVVFLCCADESPVMTDADASAAQKI